MTISSDGFEKNMETDKEQDMDKDWKSLVEKELLGNGYLKNARGYFEKEFEDPLSPKDKALVMVNASPERAKFGADYIVEKNGRKRFVHIKNFSYRYDGRCFKDEKSLMEDLRQFVRDIFDSRRDFMEEIRNFPSYFRKTPKSTALFTRGVRGHRS